MVILQNSGYSSKVIDKVISKTDRLRMKRLSTTERVQLTPGQEMVHEFVEKLCRAIKNATYKKSNKQWERQYLSYWKNASLPGVDDVSTEKAIVSTWSGNEYRLSSTMTAETTISENYY
jgi:hypothetical protein